MQKTTAVLLAIFYCVAGAPTYDERIVGGDIASAGQFPYVVSLTENNRHFCSGFIYSERWVVTTASCVSGKIPSALRAVVGQQDLTKPDANEEIISIYQIKIFTQYDAVNQANDIALIQLTKNITFSTPNGVYFINYNEVDPNNPEATVMGWGANQDGGFESTRLHYAAMDIQTGTSCGDYVSGSEFQVATMLCAQSSATSAVGGAPCQYDEGSPLVQIVQGKSTAVGIMSKNLGCSVDLPSVYTRLSVYYSWFLQTAGQQSVDETTVPTEPQTEAPITTEAVITTEEVIITTEAVEITTELVTEEVIVTTEETVVPFI
ncbi:trypsin alpha-like [Daphnia pulex]|uniref:trypsin alpha-like n=1 Tax=Daphnia pulex TaxID=6669 RepID=UPI001EDD8067|nr:trypsin alpha-like [Daphnia pulex]